ncbi:MAG: ABC transporter permease, partial [Candidatus Kerfeldbacteria bacterium]|nr:ABC transporter permease [Candidatus Kerfeldbacteria bacterium]
MRLTDTLSLALRSFTNRPKRTFLTIFGVSIGIGAVFALVSFGYGIQNVIISRITTADSLLSLDVSHGSSDLVTITAESVERIRQMPDVVEISRERDLVGQIATDEISTDVALKIVDPSHFRLSGMTVLTGDFFSDDTDHGDAVISSATVKLLGLSDNALAIGQELKVTATIAGGENATQVDFPVAFTVHGVVEDDAVGFAYLPYEYVASVLPISEYDSLKVKVASKEVSESIRDQIIGMGFVVSALSDVIEQANQIFRVVQIVLGLFGLIALFVSAIGMFNTMTIALLERTNEIGIMRSLGVTPADVRLLFIVESMLMGFLGGVGGLLLGFLAGEAANVGFNLLA